MGRSRSLRENRVRFHLLLVITFSRRNVMPESPETRPSLLVRIRDAQDRDAWGQFVELYGPVVYRFGRKRGLQDADAADLTQTVFQAVSGAIQRLDYDAA